MSVMLLLLLPCTLQQWDSKLAQRRRVQNCVDQTSPEQQQTMSVVLGSFMGAHRHP
jgi:hypothetical protein